MALSSLVVRSASEKFKPRKRFQLAMNGGGQPDESCQCKNKVSKGPHANIDASIATNVQIKPLASPLAWLANTAKSLANICRALS